MFKRKLILGSNSPRRKQILQECGIEFISISPDIDESFSTNLIKEQVPMFLAKSKVEKIISTYPLDGELVLSADTIVYLDGVILNKPSNFHEAAQMLDSLSNKKHQVITGFAISDGSKIVIDFDITNVWFKKLTVDEINYYINKFHPFDKAGAYGVQEFLGMIGMNYMEGSFYNVMGLPIHKVYDQLLKF